MDSGIGSGNSSIASSPRSAETTSGTAATPHEDFENALVSTAAEALAPRSWDNAWVPAAVFGAALLLL